MNFLEKQSFLQQDFLNCASHEERYQKIMAWGKKLLPFEPDWKTTDSLVAGCQSIMHLHASLQEGLVYFAAASDALISAGLASLLIFIYNGETPETILKNPPTFLETMGITSGLTPSRTNGLAGLYLKMRQEALKLLIAEQKTGA